jgi:hypothetical protein
MKLSGYGIDSVDVTIDGLTFNLRAILAYRPLKEETTSASTRADMAKRGFAISIVNEAIDFAGVFAVM